MEDNNVTQSGKFTIALVAMLIVVGIGLSLFLVMTGALNKQGQSLIAMTNTLDETKISQYDQRTDITGTQVASLTKSWANESVYVTVKAGSTYNVYYNGADFANPMSTSDVRTITQGMSNKGSKYYVNPSGIFKCEVVYNDKTDVLEGVVFTQM